MLVIIDMQNEYVDEKGKANVRGAKELGDGILDRIKYYEDKGETIFYTINTKVSHEDRDEEDVQWARQPYGKLKEALKNHHMIEKLHYGISAENAIEIKEKMKEDIDTKTIEFVGVETNVCVLANCIIFQNIFPDAEIVINSKLCNSSEVNLHHDALNLMKELKMEVI